MRTHQKRLQVCLLPGKLQKEFAQVAFKHRMPLRVFFAFLSKVEDVIPFGMPHIRSSFAFDPIALEN